MLNMRNPIGNGKDNVPVWYKVGTAIASVATPAGLAWLIAIQADLSGQRADIAAVKVGLNGGNGAIGMSDRIGVMQEQQLLDSKKLDAIINVKKQSDENAQAI